MKLHQVVIRPEEHTVFVLYVDSVGRKNSIIFDSTGNATVDQLMTECQQRLPPDSANPGKAQIQDEITALEGRLTLLKQAIGTA